MEIREVPKKVFDQLVESDAIVDEGRDDTGRRVLIGALQDSQLWLRWVGDSPTAAAHQGETTLLLFADAQTALGGERGNSLVAMVASSHVDGWYSHPQFAVFKAINFSVQDRRISREMTFSVMQPLAAALDRICTATTAICKEHHIETFHILKLESAELEAAEPAAV